jgi:hypothetical protein
MEPTNAKVLPDFYNGWPFGGQVIETTHLFACSRVAEVKALLACMGHKTFI